jgi:RNA polymerase sigma-70 factor (ECF subfamily)
MEDSPHVRDDSHDRERRSFIPGRTGNNFPVPAVQSSMKRPSQRSDVTEGIADRFERVMLPHLDDAYTLARYLLRDEHDAQDVVQDAALRALRYFEGFSGDDARAWLLAIVRNCALDWRRRHRVDERSVPFDDVAHGSAGAARDADAAAIAWSERARVQRALDELPFEFREVIVLREVQELRYREISDVLGVPIGTVMSRLARARRQLAALLDPDAREVS